MPPAFVLLSFTPLNVSACVRPCDAGHWLLGSADTAPRPKQWPYLCEIRDLSKRLYLLSQMLSIVICLSGKTCSRSSSTQLAWHLKPHGGQRASVLQARWSLRLCVMNNINGRGKEQKESGLNSLPSLEQMTGELSHGGLQAWDMWGSCPALGAQQISC